jgi:BASS family bile acid:Na+ symporter
MMPVQSFQAFAEAVLVPIQLFLALLGMGATLTVRDFLRVFEQPRGLAVGVGMQWLVVPAITAAFVALFDLSPGWAVGLVLVAAVPGGATSNLFTFLGRGNVPLSIAVTVTTTLACIGMIPLILRILAAPYLPEGFSFPTLRILRDIAIYLLLPLALGMVVRRVKPGAADTFSKWAIRGSVLAIAIIAVSSLGSGRIDLKAYGWGPPLVLVGFLAFLTLVSPQLVRLVGHDDADATAIGIEVVVRNVGIGLLLLRFFFPDDPAEQGKVLFTCLFYSGGAGLFALPLLLRGRAGKSPALFRKPLTKETPSPAPEPEAPRPDR